MAVFVCFDCRSIAITLMIAATRAVPARAIVPKAMTVFVSTVFGSYYLMGRRKVPSLWLNGVNSLRYLAYSPVVFLYLAR